MSISRSFLVFFVMAALAFAQSANTEGGNITALNVTSNQSSFWFGVCGQTSPAAAVPLTITAVPGNISCYTINTGSSSCTYGVKNLDLLFSNSSTAITALSRGNLTALDLFINRPGDNGTTTLGLSTSFTTANFGDITGVPTAYTNSPTPNIFRMGYLKDQADDFVFITTVLSDQPGFNGSLFDFQFMLPTNGSNTSYYLTVDLACNPPPTEPPGGGEGGGGTHTPYYNVSNVTVPQPPNITNVTCEIVLYCGEWGPCLDGYRQQSCKDLSNCSTIEVFRIEKCGVTPTNVTPPIVPEEIVTIIVQPEFQCWILLLILIPIIAYVIYRKWKSEAKAKK